MKVVKLGFNLSDYAVQRGMKLNSFKMQDKTTVNILCNRDCDIAEFYHTDGDNFLGAKGYRGKNAIYNALTQMLRLTKNSSDAFSMTEAWRKCIEP